MEDNSYLPNCGDDDVLQFESNMFRVRKVREAMNYVFTNPNILVDNIENALKSQQVTIHRATIIRSLTNGADCEFLSLGAKGWQTGKFRIRVSVEFYPDEPEINQPEWSLDSMRQEINKNTHQGNS